MDWLRHLAFVRSNFFSGVFSNTSWRVVAMSYSLVWKMLRMARSMPSIGAVESSITRILFCGAVGVTLGALSRLNFFSFLAYCCGLRSMMVSVLVWGFIVVSVEGRIFRGGVVCIFVYE